MKSVLLLALTLTMFVAAGCSGSNEPDPQLEAKREAAAKNVRDIYDRAGGNWDALTAADKASLLKEFDNKEENAKRMWDLIKSKSGPARSGATPPPAGASMGSSSMGAGSMRPDGG